MFSGIVAGQGLLRSVRARGLGFRVIVEHGGLGRGVCVGDSVAVDGCCLTVVSHQKRVFQFDVLKETWDRTILSRIKPPWKVNLERALRAGEPMGGHFVTGHIDGVGKVVRCQKVKTDVYWEVAPPRGFLKWALPKGSVAVDGVSLTVDKVGAGRFGVWLIPHTLKLTTLGWKRQGDWVNLEGDMLAKYAQKAIPSS